MGKLWQTVDRVLRGQYDASARIDWRRTRELLTVVVVLGAVYGAVMGTFGCFGGGATLVLVYAAVKVPLLLLCVFAVGLPSFLVLNALMGLREDSRAVCQALLATQAGMAIVLASLAPFTFLWYCSAASYAHAVAFNALMFGVASAVAQLLLRRQYQPLIQRQPKHRYMMVVWIVIYAAIGIQAAWLLRPFVGNPNTPLAFFRPDAFSKNAYEVVFELLRKVAWLSRAE